jgi:hypothetical protein
MIRAWYMQVQDETLAPARMVEFMERHVRSCDACLLDPGIREELKKITAIVLPVSKMTKPPKRGKDDDDLPLDAELDDIEADDEETVEDDDDEVVDDDEEEDEEEDDDEDIEVDADVDLDDVDLV